MELAPAISASSLRTAATAAAASCKLRRKNQRQCPILHNSFQTAKRFTGTDHYGLSVATHGGRVIATAGGSAVAEVGVGEKESGIEGIAVLPGTPMPLGATARDAGVNFAIFSSGATSATLCLFTVAHLQENTITKQIPLDPLTNKTGDVWHVFLEGDFGDMLYGYKFDGKFSPNEGHYFDPSYVLLDPYAKAVLSRPEYGILEPGGSCWPQMAGMIPTLTDRFDWEGDMPLNHPTRDLVIYEMHVRGFTRHESSGTDFPGTYIGVVEKLDYLKANNLQFSSYTWVQEINFIPNGKQPAVQ